MLSKTLHFESPQLLAAAFAHQKVRSIDLLNGVPADGGAPFRNSFLIFV